MRIGALVRHAQLERHEGAYAALPLLRQALLNVAHPVIRNRGTTVGSIAHADPSGEMPAVLALLDGHVEVASARGTRQIASADFFLGPLESSLAEDEMAVGASFRRLAGRHGHGLPGVGPPARRLRPGRCRRRGHGRRRRRHRRARCPSSPSPPPRTSWTSPRPSRAARCATSTGPRPPSRPASTSTPTRTSTPRVAYRRMLVGVLTTRALAQAAAAATGDLTDTDGAPQAGAARKA